MTRKVLPRKNHRWRLHRGTVCDRCGLRRRTVTRANRGTRGLKQVEVTVYAGKQDEAWKPVMPRCVRG